METAFVPAIVTPFKPGSLEVDTESLKSYLKVATQFLSSPSKF